MLMRPTPQLSVETWGWGIGRSAGGCVGGVLALRRGVPKVGGPARDPLLPHAYLWDVCLGVRKYPPSFLRKHGRGPKS